MRDPEATVSISTVRGAGYMPATKDKLSSRGYTVSGNPT